MNSLAEAIAWFCLAGLFYAYAGYPLLAMLQAALLPKPFRVAPFQGKVSVLIAVYNDAARLVPKLQALLKVRGADQILEILVGSDGSTDDVAAAVRALREPRIRVLEFGERRGKAAVLNQLMTLAEGDAVVLMDARQILREDALEHLLAPLADPRIGVVSGHLVFRKRDGGGGGAAETGVGSYWNYEKLIRRAESRSGSVPGATGALYAIRRSLLFPIDPAAILDDVLIPMQAVQRGARCVFAADAVCFDEASETSAKEQIRKRRTIAGNLQIVALKPSWLLPWGHPLWWRFLSHKLSRVFSPFFLIGLLVANGFLLENPAWRSLLALQLLGWSMSLLGVVFERCGRRTKVLSVPLMFASMNLATLLAWFDAVRGRFTAAWQRS